MDANTNTAESELTPQHYEGFIESILNTDDPYDTLTICLEKGPDTVQRLPEYAARLLVRAECDDPGVAAALFCCCDPITACDQVMIERAKRLARGWHNDVGNDCVGEPFRFVGWSLGLRNSRPKGEPYSVFADAAERDAADCPLRAGEIAAEITSAVASFLAYTDKDSC